MFIISGVISLLAGVTGVFCIYVIYKKSMEKKRNGKLISGRKISCEEIAGQPVRYSVEVEYRLDHKDYRKRIVTVDKRIKEYKNNEQIPLLYIDTINKRSQGSQVFWAEDQSKEWLVLIVLLAVFSGFMFSLSGVCFVLYLGVIL